MSPLVTICCLPVLGPAGEPPLDPSPDRARSLLRRELLRPEYNDTDPVQRFLDWLQRRIESGLDRASNAPPLPTVAAVVVFLGLVVLLCWLVSRARRTAPAAGERAVLTPARPTAAELRGRAQAALAAGEAELAVVEAFRALTTRQIEVGRIADLPGATAHEVTQSLATAYPDERRRIDDSATVFDRVLYGDRPATAEQATRVLALDDDLARVR